jgi:acyl transferase domain-containing protein
LEGAAALPGILKVIVALEAGQIPPSLGVETLNPRIDFEKAKVHVVTDVVPWPKDKLKRASVTSAGFGGTNGHCIIDHVGNHFPSYIKPGIISQELDSKPNPSALHEKSALAPPMASRADADTRRMVVLPFSAHNENSLKSNMEVLTNVIGKHSLADVAYTLAAKRSRLARRAFQIVDKTSVDGGFVDQAFFKAPSKQSHVAFVFTGQGAQWHAMGAELMEYRVFQDSLASLDNILSKLPQPPSWKLSDVLRGNCEDSFIQRPEISQAACTGLQIGLVDLLASWSVRPAAVVGHSSGEMAAAYAAGAISAAEAITAAYFRGQNVSNNKQKGAMLAVGFGPDTAAKYLVDLNDKVKIAAINSPESMTLSGDADAVTELSERLNDEGVFNRLLKTGGLAYHSHHMLPLGSGYSEELSAGIARLKDQGVFEETKKFSSVPWISSVQPEESVSEQTDMAPYWRANLESPVRFSEAVAKLLSLEDLKVGAFIEIGPHPALKSPLRQIAQSLGQTVTHIATVKRSEDAMKTMLALAGSLFGINAEVNLVAVNAVDDESQKTGLAHGCMAVDLPPYQYTYGPINYHESRISKEYRLRKTPHHDLLGSRVVGTTRLRPQWRNLIRIKDIPWLDDHRVPPRMYKSSFPFVS